MIEECDVINNLVQELLYMSKLEADIECKMEKFHVNELKDNILSRMENEFSGENITVDMYPAEIVADINLMKRALMNFITNAIKHHNKDSEIQVRGYIEGEHYVFAVTNEGKEITDEQKELIWDVFYKNDEARSRSAGGHGIGLAIVKRIAELHGGEVDLTSESGKNTFCIKIKHNT
jgi:signal transduction histidine kinase